MRTHEPPAWLLAREMRTTARQLPCNGGGTGIVDRYVLERGHRVHVHSGSSLTYTRDAGMHSGGWWKNPDYERCFHLSLCFFDPETREWAPHNHKMAQEWCTFFFGDARRMLWIEPPLTKPGKQAGTWHYRLFMDESWTVPLLPRGEVYSRELTEAGWKSWSELHAEQEAG